MAVDKSYARLGLFVVVALVVLLATAFLFIQRMKSRAVIEMVTYTRDNVSGLDVSSPVRFRGVPVGRISELRVDPRSSTIQIDFEVFLDRLNTIGANVERLRRTADLEGMFPTLRAQVVANPVTGEAYLLLDAPANPPPPIALGFTPDRAYIPSMPSPFSRVQDRLPELMERAEATLQTLRDIIARVPDSLDQTDRFFTSLERVIKESDLPALSADSRKFFAATSAQIDKMTADLNGLVGTGGTLMSFADEARAAINAADFVGSAKSTRAAMDQTALAAEDLRRALPGIRDSLEQLRRLARQIEEQPESMVYGPRPPPAKRQ
ncbi:MAG TPA: MlaD family protein [Vicinamibacterales bacterium]|jgi:ABC-type transporter Mla subunit MlaD|nr:MlaD family protein [Vicinamibacterales bacterium]HEX2462601.1 MlaD family protein [Vicinamibacterales bacterium]